MATDSFEHLTPRTQMTAMNRGFAQRDIDCKVVNPPIYRASTFLFETYQDMTGRGHAASAQGRFPYGLYGTDTVRQFEQMVATLEGCEDAVASGSGMSACAIPFLTFLGAGDHVLVTDSVYGPVRALANNQLVRLGIDVEYYDPMTTPQDLAEKLRPNTTMLYLESPGSATFEVQDIRGLAKLAKDRGIITAIDNTWATPIYYRPAQVGVDLVIHAATKYMGGASDLMLGVVAGPKDLVAQMAKAQGEYGYYTNPDDAYSCIRGMRSLAVRMPVHLESSLIVAKHLAQRTAEITDVLHPAMPGDLMHQRYLAQGFEGGGGLFSVIFDPALDQGFVARFANALTLFGMGYSWGGFESLISAQAPKHIRTASDWPRAPLSNGTLLRFNIGLEDPSDLCADIDQAFDTAIKGAPAKGLFGAVFGGQGK